MTEPAAPAPIPPGGAIGVLGGGQLGRMLALAAARLGVRCHVYAPEADPPAGQVCERTVRGDWDDAEALARFAQGVDVVTYEFENVPVAAVEALAKVVPVRPGARSLAVSQDRAEEKRFFAGLGLGAAGFATVDRPEELAAALESVGAPAILKTRRLGYDGKGQARIADASQAAAAWEAVGEAPSILEAVVPFTRELSVVGARGLDGATVCYDPVQNRHEDGILRETVAPAPPPVKFRFEAVAAAARILDALGHVGVLAVELFETPDGIAVNEIAPRVHNSGHWTQDACDVDQFEQHVRAICGWPLGDGSRRSDATMTNLLGDDAHDWRGIAAEPGARLHLYGKAEARPGRKMGHVNRVRPRG